MGVLIEMQPIRKESLYELITPLDDILPYHLRPTTSQLWQYRPRAEWMACPNAPMGSDHSLDHPARLQILMEYYIRSFALQNIYIPDSTVEALRWFPAIHDSQRFDDGYDVLHGLRAARFARNNLSDHLSAEALNTLQYLCLCHVPHDHRQRSLTIAGAIAKDVDMLDRFRGCNDFNPTYIRLGLTYQLAYHARMLHALSLQVGSEDHYQNAITAGCHLGIVIEE